jgi:hypothetical protein
MRVTLAIIGLAVLGYGAYGWLTHDGSRPVGQVVFLGLLVVLHDFLVIPLILGVGALVLRFASPAARLPVQAGLAVSAAAGLVALPFVIGAGRIADNPSAFPQSYGRGLLLILAVIWLTAGGWWAVRALRAR